MVEKAEQFLNIGNVNIRFKSEITLREWSLIRMIKGKIINLLADKVVDIQGKEALGKRLFEELPVSCKRDLLYLRSRFRQIGQEIGGLGVNEIDEILIECLDCDELQKIYDFAQKNAEFEGEILDLKLSFGREIEAMIGVWNLVEGLGEEGFDFRDGERKVGLIRLFRGIEREGLILKKELRSGLKLVFPLSKRITTIERSELESFFEFVGNDGGGRIYVEEAGFKGRNGEILKGRIRIGGAVK